MHKTLLSVSFLVAMGTGCGGAKKATTPLPTTSTLMGHVFNVDLTPVAGAALSLVDGRAQGASEASGAYSLTVPALSGTEAVLLVESPGHVRQALRVVLPERGSSSDFVILLQPKAATTTVAMPEANTPPAVVTAGLADGSASLQIPHGALIDGAGQAVVGNVDVALTYFHPRSRAAAMPVRLLAENTNTQIPDPLTTFGMADIEITQNGSMLAVAPGAYLALDFNAPQSLHTYVNDHNQDIQYQPRLYSADITTGLWVEEGRLGGALLAYDTNANVFNAKLPHLSAWNIDSLDYGQGGCARGTVNVMGKSGKEPAANTAVRVWFAGRDEIGFFDATTDASGSYCIEPGIAHGAPDNIVRYYVSAQDNVNDSDMCNPMPSYCSACVNTTIAHDCQKCGLRDSIICSEGAAGEPYGNYDIIHNVDGPGGCNPLPGCNTGSSEGDLRNCVSHSGSDLVPSYQDSCPGDQRWYALLKAGTHCGGSCTELQAVTLGTSGSKISGSGTASGQSEPAKPPVCDPKNPTTKTLGQACVPGKDVCCPIADNLVCSDYICVPSSDGKTK